LIKDLTWSYDLSSMAVVGQLGLASDGLATA
jgi:hypothetical protein